MHSVALDTSRVVWLQLLGYRQPRRSKVAYLIEHEVNVRAVTVVSTQYLRLIVFVQMTPQSPVFRNGGGSDGRRFVHAPRNLHQLAPVAAFDHVAVLIHTTVASVGHLKHMLYSSVMLPTKPAAVWMCRRYE